MKSLLVAVAAAGVLAVWSGHSRSEIVSAISPTLSPAIAVEASP